MKYLLISLFTALFVIGVPSCCDDQIFLIVGIHSVRFHTEQLQSPVTSGVVEGDSLYMDVRFSTRSYTDAGIPSFSLTTSAYAYECDLYVRSGNYIEDITITSNKDFNAIPAGSPLNSLIRTADGVQFLDEFIDQHQSYETDYSPRLELVFIEKPDIADHFFSFRFTDNAGNQFEGKSELIVWQ